MDQEIVEQQTSLTAAKVKLKSERKQYKTDLKKLRGENADLKFQLTAVSAELRALKSRTTPVHISANVSDRDIANAYEDLCEAIDKWVSENCEEFLTWSQNPDVGFFPARGSALLPKLPILMEARKFNDTACIGFHLQQMIFRHLYDTILCGRRWMPGVSEEQEDVLRVIENKLLCVDPNELANIQKAWRLSAYQSIDRCYRMQEIGLKHLDRMIHDLYNKVVPFVDEEGFGTLDKALAGLVKLVYAAVRLADNIRSCEAQYHLIFNLGPKESSKFYTINASSLSYFRFIDSQTGRHVKEQKTNDEDSDTFMGDVKRAISPYLVKLESDGTIVKLVKGLAIVRLRSTEIGIIDNKIKQAAATHESPSASLPGWADLLIRLRPRY